VLTLKTSRSSMAIFHSSGTNSYFRRSKPQTAVIASMATQYWIANSSMSNVEFQQVETSRGIICVGRPWVESIFSHAGNKMVVEFFNVNAMPHS